MLWFIFILTVLITWEATRLSIQVSLRRGVLDIPNPRSSHWAMVPRIGGIGILSGFYLSLAGLWLSGHWGLIRYPLNLRQLIVISIVGGGMAATGLYDDFYRLSPGAKYAFQFILALVVLGFRIRLEIFPIPLWGTLTLGVFSIPLTLLWLTGFANIYNFMDGIDGLAAGTGVFYSGFLSFLAWRQGSQALATVGLLLAGSCLGFLFHNFPRAHTFMGDTGSLFLGMVLGLLVVWIAQLSSNPESLIALLLVCSVFLYDSAFTLFRRLRHHENIFMAHRSHLYQRLVQSGWSHAKVTSLYLLLHALMGCLGVVYLGASSAGRLQIVGIAFLAFSFFTAGVYWVEYRFAQRKADKQG